MWTTFAICSAASTLSLGDTVTSVLRIMYDFGPNDWTMLSELVVDPAMVQVESVLRDRSVQPEKTDSGAVNNSVEDLYNRN